MWMRLLKEPAFFDQLSGNHGSNSLTSNKIEAVSGATLTSLAIVDAISLRFGGEKQASRFPNPIQIEEVQEHIPEHLELIPSATHPSLLEILDINGIP